MLNIIVAMDKNGLIGRNNSLPWHLPSDLKHFKQITEGNTIIMGRKTFESIGKPLPDRDNLILSRKGDFITVGSNRTWWLNDWTSILKWAIIEPERQYFIIGGSEIFKLFLSHVNRMYITHINHEFKCNVCDGHGGWHDGDGPLAEPITCPECTYFPYYDESEWELISSNVGIRDSKNPYDYTFNIYDRISF